MTQHFLLGEAAKILGRRPYQIDYLLKTRQVPEPDLRVANKRLFTEQDIRRLARRLGAEPDWSVAGRDAGVCEPEAGEGLALRPPFDVLPTGESGHEVRDGNGAVFAWAGDRARALVIAGLLEAAARG